MPFDSSRWRFTAPLLFAAVIGACAPGGAVAPSVETLGPAHAAGLSLYDQLAPAFSPNSASSLYEDTLGPARPLSENCVARYQAEALQARCAALTIALQAANRANDASNGAALSVLSSAVSRVTGGTADPFVNAVRGALSHDGQSADLTRDLLIALNHDSGRIYALERAARVVRLQKHDHAFLEQMDQVFDLANGRSVPDAPSDRANFEQATLQISELLARPSPAYGASSLFAVMDENGPPLTSAEIGAITKNVQAAGRSVALFDQVAENWRAVAQAITAYDRLIKAALHSTEADSASARQSVSSAGLEMLAALTQIRKVRK